MIRGAVIDKTVRIIYIAIIASNIPHIRPPVLSIVPITGSFLINGLIIFKINNNNLTVINIANPTHTVRILSVRSVDIVSKTSSLDFSAFLDVSLI